LINVAVLTGESSRPITSRERLNPGSTSTVPRYVQDALSTAGDDWF
jgi:hypothetical protein